MASFAIVGAAGVMSAAVVGLKGAFEVQTHFGCYENNVLARQGQGMPEAPGRLNKQKVGGIKKAGGAEEPSWVAKVPKKPAGGDIRGMYKDAAGTSFTNNTATLDDILSAVPKKSYGGEAYQSITRPRPKNSSISNEYL